MNSSRRHKLKDPAKRSGTSLVFSIEDVIEQTGLCRQTIYNEINAERLRTFMVGRRRLVSYDALMDWIRSREADAAA